MICPHCKSEFESSVCPKCSKPVRMRSGLNVPWENTLVEIPVDQGEKYARYFRIAVLRPDEKRPMKLAFGEDERPMDYLEGKKSWFNPVKIPPDKLHVLRDIAFNLLAAQVAFESKVKGLKVPDQAVTAVRSRIITAVNSGELQRLAVKFIKMMEG